MATDAAQKPRKSHEEVLSFLDDLESYSSAAPKSSSATPASSGAGASAPPGAPAGQDAQSVLDFLDEITQRSSTPTASLAARKPAARPLSRQDSRTSMTATAKAAAAGATEGAARKSTDSMRSLRASRPSMTPPTVEPAPAPVEEPALADNGGGWGWGSVFKQASSVLQQAKSVAEQARSAAEGSDLVKNLNQNLQHNLQGQGESAKKWSEGVMSYVKASGIEQIGKDLGASGLKSLTEILHAVVPPISEHEIIEVQLSYDMVGYDGIEVLVYRSLAKIMEQVRGGDLILNKGEEEKPREPGPDEPVRDLQAVEGLQEGYKLAKANLDSLVKAKFRPEPAAAEAAPAPQQEAALLPITRCPVFVRIQPILALLPAFPPSTSSAPATAAPIAGLPLDQEKHLFFLVLLRDPTNELSHATMSQSMPASWLDVPFEENEWVEDVMVEVIRRATEVIGQQYVNGRLTGRSLKNTANTRLSAEEGRPATKSEDSAVAAAATIAAPGVV